MVEVKHGVSTTNYWVFPLFSQGWFLEWVLVFSLWDFAAAKPQASPFDSSRVKVSRIGGGRFGLALP